MGRRLLDAGTPRRAVQLLEPLFTRPERLDKRHEEAFDALIDAYDALGWYRKKAETLDTLAARTRPPLSAAVWVRLATIAADRGAWDAAWEHFHRARRDAPDHPALPHLEVTLLLFQGKPEQASQRARFALARSRREGLEPEDSPGIEFLERAAADPATALEVITDKALAGAAARFHALLATAQERPLPAYRLHRNEGEAVGA